jgi:L-alanine-DL-glutamate epimerase-like enolase superfamily enzyme
MRPSWLACYNVVLPFKEGGYRMSGGRQLSGAITTVVEVGMEDGTTGYGEACTLGGTYIEDFAGSASEAVRELAPVVLRHEVMDYAGLVRSMDVALMGQLAGKSAIDSAMWDLRGKLLRLPVAVLLGGVQLERYHYFGGISLDTPEAMAADVATKLQEGWRCFQVKVGDDPRADIDRLRAVYDVAGSVASFITCDANAGWSCAQAKSFLAKTLDMDIFIEQPCSSLEDLAELRRAFPKPMIADESIRVAGDLARCFAIGAVDAVNIKPARVGGITKAAWLRDFAQEIGLMIMIDDAKGSEICAAGVAQLAASCRPDRFLSASYGPRHVEKSLIKGGGVRLDSGWAYPPQEGGLGIQVDRAALGDPLFRSAM